jgi:hypothetical protein
VHTHKILQLILHSILCCMPRSIKGSIHIGDVFKLKAFSPRVNFITSASKNRYLQKRIGFFPLKVTSLEWMQITLILTSFRFMSKKGSVGSGVDRVTRLGEFWPSGRLLTLGSFLNCRSSPNVLANFSTVKIVH